MPYFRPTCPWETASSHFITRQQTARSVTGGPNAPIRVVPMSFGIYTLNGLGLGPALLLDANGNSIDVTYLLSISGRS